MRVNTRPTVLQGQAPLSIFYFDFGDHAQLKNYAQCQDGAAQYLVLFFLKHNKHKVNRETETREQSRAGSGN